MKNINNYIYLDNAATGYPKPISVKNAVYRAFDKYGGNPGRSGHNLSLEASKAIYKCRERICDFINFGYPERIIFTQNATHALNLAINGLSVKGGHILISNLEHNSVYRPVYALCNNASNNIDFSLFDATSDSDEIIIDNFMNGIKENTSLAVVTAASNVCGKILPLKKISDICKKYAIKLIVDASQALGLVEFDFTEIGADVVCCAGHKGLYGPVGTGFAAFSQEVLPEPLIYGGNGLTSELPDMGNVLPEMLEAGTLNTVGICGLEAGIKHITDYGVCSIREKCKEFDYYISEELINLGAVLYTNFKSKIPIILFNFPKIPAEKISGYLDELNICTRSGIHCSPLAHKALFTGKSGAIRVSPGHFNSMKDCKDFISAVNKFLRSKI